jgi:hypothetical protein
MIATVAASALLLALASGLSWLMSHGGKRGHPARAAAMDSLRAAVSELTSAEHTREQALKTGRKAVDSAVTEYASTVQQRQEAVDSLRDPMGRWLASYRGVTLYERWITTPQCSGPLVDISASVEAQLTSRITDHASARQFAATVGDARRQAEVLEAARPARLARAEQALDVARADTAGVTVTHAELERLEHDESLLAAIQHSRQNVLAAEQRLARAMAAPSSAPAVGSPKLHEESPQGVVVRPAIDIDRRHVIGTAHP